MTLLGIYISGKIIPSDTTGVNIDFFSDKSAETGLYGQGNCSQLTPAATRVQVKLVVR